MSQNAMKVEKFSKQVFPRWSYEPFSLPGDRLRLEAIPVEIPLSEIYRGLGSELA